MALEMDVKTTEAIRESPLRLDVSWMQFLARIDSLTIERRQMLCDKSAEKADRVSLSLPARDRKSGIVRGSAHCRSLLNERQVIEIRASGMTAGRLAILYGVSYGAIDNIIKRRTWKHVS